MFQELSANSNRNNNCSSRAMISTRPFMFHRSKPPWCATADFPPDFRSCLGCDGAEHVFRYSPMQADPATVERCHRNYNIKSNRPRRDAPYGHVPPHLVAHLPSTAQQHLVPVLALTAANRPGWPSSSTLELAVLPLPTMTTSPRPRLPSDLETILSSFDPVNTK